MTEPRGKEAQDKDPNEERRTAERNRPQEEQDERKVRAANPDEAWRLDDDPLGPPQAADPPLIAQAQNEALEAQHGQPVPEDKRAAKR